MVELRKGERGAVQGEISEGEPLCPNHESRLQRWSKLLTHFMVGQSSVQALNLIVGFLLLRWMSVAAYAQYSTAFAFQSTLNQLVDLGFSGCIVALVGTRRDEPGVVGTYVRNSRHLRLRMFLIIGLASGIAFPLVVARQPWPAELKFALWVSVILAVLVQGQMLYGAPLLMQRSIRTVYASQVAASGFRALSLVIMHFGRVLTSSTASCVGSVALGLQGYLYKRYGSRLIVEPKRPDLAVIKEIRTYLAPLWPGMIYYAFQSQITIGLISIFGKTQNIAEVAALGRLGQLFLLLSAMNGAIIEPYIAQVGRHMLAKRYILIASACFVISFAITTCASIAPEPFLWLLGAKYVQLKPLIGWMMLSSSLGYFAGVLFMMNTARKWVYWRTTLPSLTAVILVQAGLLFELDLRRTSSMIGLSIGMSLSTSVAFICVAIYGYYHTNSSESDLSLGESKCT